MNFLNAPRTTVLSVGLRIAPVSDMDHSVEDHLVEFTKCSIEVFKIFSVKKWERERKGIYFW